MKLKRSHYRFFIDPTGISPQGEVVITDEGIIRQITKVFRLHVGDLAVVLDNTGYEYEVELTKISRDQVVGKVISTVQEELGSTRQVILFFPVLKPGRVEFLLEKATELGVTQLIPVIYEKSIKKEHFKMDRWKKIILEAAEQSHRRFLPILESPVDLTSALQRVQGDVLVADEKAREDSTKIPQRTGVSSVSLLIGPEGGFSDAERDIFRDKGYQFISLSENVLRAETAAILAVGKVLLV
ncbi:MAG: RsmE family RNA methyltransferase [Patescibacteria group bacterium]